MINLGLDWLGPVASVAGSVIGGLFGKSNASEAREEQYAYNKRLMEQQHNYNVSDYQHRYQWATDDLRNAGLNPILAATNGIGGSINGTGLASASAVQAPTPDFAGSINTAFANKQAKEIAARQADLQERAIENQEADTWIRGYEAHTHRLEVESANSARAGHLALEQQAQKFDQDLKREWQDFAIENQSRLTELKTQETAATIRHLAAQDASLSTMAQVALRDSATREILAKVAVDNGISHRALEAAQAVVAGKQADFYEKYGNTQEAQAELARAQTALAEYKRTTGPIETTTDIMKGILSIAVGAKVGYDLYGDITGHNSRIGF